MIDRGIDKSKVAFRDATEAGPWSGFLFVCKCLRLWFFSLHCPPPPSPCFTTYCCVAVEKKIVLVDLFYLFFMTQAVDGLPSTCENHLQACRLRQACILQV